jgi:hypothetical protein
MTDHKTDADNFRMDPAAGSPRDLDRNDAAFLADQDSVKLFEVVFRILD